MQLKRPNLITAVFLAAGLVLLSSGIFASDADVLPVRTDRNGYEIIINLPARELHLYRYGVRVKSYPVGVGAIVTPSHLGSTRIVNSVSHPTYYPPNWYLRGLEPIPPGPENPVGTRWLGLEWAGFGIHGTNNPASIGTLASAGCIRMYNEDVEELAGLVGIGTPVTFIYEPIEVERDPLTGRHVITVHPDVYGLGTHTVENALRILERHGIARDVVSTSGLRMLLADSTGEPAVVPYDTTVSWMGEPVPQAGFHWGGRDFVSVHRLAALLDEEFALERGPDRVLVNDYPLADYVWVGSELYAAPESAAAALGLGQRRLSGDAGSAYEFYPIRLVYANEVLPFRAFADGGWLLIPLIELAEVLDIDVSWDYKWQTVVSGDRPIFMGRLINNTFYFPHDRLPEVFGITVRWQPGDREAYLARR